MRKQTMQLPVRAAIIAVIPLAAVLAAGCHHGDSDADGSAPAVQRTASSDPRLQQFETARDAAMEADAKRRAAAVANWRPN